MTVSRLESEMSGRELIEWNAYYSVEPFGQWRDNMHAALIASTVFNVGRTSSKTKSVKPEDFILKEKAHTAKKLRSQLAHLVKR